jgi:hypothetical protein
LTPYSFKLVGKDTRSFQPHLRQGIVENVKIPKKISYHSLKQSMHNPIASTDDGILITPCIFGRPD